MKKKSLSKLLLLVPVFSLSACGYSLREIYNGNAYNDVVFNNNFYREHDEKMEKKAMVLPEAELNKDTDYVFRNFEESNFAEYCEPHSREYDYNDNKGYFDENKKQYGEANKLSLVDSSFKRGYISKLFDGQMFCDGDYQLARVQIDENGFSKAFSKELSQSDYFAMNFKASLDYTVHNFVSASKSEIDLKIGFYIKGTGNKYTLKQVKYHLDNVPTNTGDGHDFNSYVFFGFSLKNIDITRCAGISIGYELLDCKGVYYNSETKTNTTLTMSEIKSEGISHSLMIYEVMFPHSTWH